MIRKKSFWNCQRLIAPILGSLLISPQEQVSAKNLNDLEGYEDLSVNLNSRSKTHIIPRVILAQANLPNPIPPRTPKPPIPNSEPKQTPALPELPW